MALDEETAGAEAPPLPPPLAEGDGVDDKADDSVESVDERAVV